MIHLTNGFPQGPNGLIVPNGSIKFQLNVDATIIAAPYGFVCADVPVVFQFNAAGQIQPNAPAATADIWSNEELDPQNTAGLGTFYLVTFYDQNGAVLNSTPLWWIFPETNGSTVDISQMIAISTVGGNVIYYPRSIGGAGTVTSVTFTGDGTVLSSTPSAAVTTTGTIAATLLTQSANLVFAGPTTGAAAAPTFRALVAADVAGLTSTPGGATTNVQTNISSAFYGDGNFTYTPSGTPTVTITGNLTQTGLVQITGPASAGTNPLAVISSNNGPTNVLGSVLAMTNSGGSTTTGYLIKGANNSLLLQNDGASIPTHGVLGFLADGTAEMLAGTNGAQFQMNTVAGSLPAGSVAWALPLSGVGTARFHISSPTPGFFWDWDGGTGEMYQTFAHGEIVGLGSSTELLTLSTGSAHTDTVGNLLPAGAIIDSVVIYITQTISGGSTPTTIAVGDAGTSNRFISTGTPLTAGSSAVGLNQIDAGTSSQTAAAKVRVTLDQIPGQGIVRITVFWRQFSAPTS